MTAILAYAKFVREKYTYIILATLVIAVVVGLFTPSPGLFIRQFNTPLIVILIAAMSFTITFQNLAIGIAAMSFKGLATLPIAVAFAFQMLTAVSFYQLFRRAIVT